MSKRKIRYKEPKIFTEEEVLQAIAEYEEKYVKHTQPRRSGGKVQAEWWQGHKGNFFGFEYNYQFVKLDCGWIEGPEMICEYCVWSLVNSYGTEAERKEYNKTHTLGKNYNCWITNKEYAQKRKKAIHSKRRTRQEIKRYERNERRGIKPVFVEA